jgi:hypothetical protein
MEANSAILGMVAGPLGLIKGHPHYQIRRSQGTTVMMIGAKEEIGIGTSLARTIEIAVIIDQAETETGTTTVTTDQVETIVTIATTAIGRGMAGPTAITETGKEVEIADPKEITGIGTAIGTGNEARGIDRSHLLGYNFCILVICHSWQKKLFIPSENIDDLAKL